MTFKEKVATLKEKFQAKINADSSEEEIEEINSYVNEIESLSTEFQALVDEHAKVKESLVRMVVNQGSSDQPKDDLDGSKPKTIEECVAEQLAKGN